MRLFHFEKSIRQKGFELIAGVDEVGRGSLAGPVVASAVILPQKCSISGLNDSKKLRPKKRERLFSQIQKEAISIGIGLVIHRVIDEINILEATKRAMVEAIFRLKKNPDYLLIDGKTPLDISIQQKTIVKGDSISASIASASIVAKVTRDKIMNNYDRIFPLYKFSSHKGYATKNHIDAIKNFGVCGIHRRSFKRVKEYVI